VTMSSQQDEGIRLELEALLDLVPVSGELGRAVYLEKPLTQLSTVCPGA
jgi:hypothetical protein